MSPLRRGPVRFRRKPERQRQSGLGRALVFLPIVGLILFLVWRQEKPKSARVSGIGALIGTGVNVLLSIGTLIFNFVVIAAAMSAVAV